MKVLLFVQTGDTRPKCVKRFPPVLRHIKSGWEEWSVEYSKTATADRWWLVECENADEGRTIIGCCPLDDHRILASGGRHA